jgi:tetratricopeptide (TPR) repeat protein
LIQIPGPVHGSAAAEGIGAKGAEVGGPKHRWQEGVTPERAFGTRKGLWYKYAMEEVRKLLMAAVKALNGGQLKEAERLCRAALDKDPHPEAFNLLGAIASSRGRNDDAVDYMRKAIELGGGSSDFRLNLAQILEKKSYENIGRGEGHITEALAHYRWVVKQEPANVTAVIGTARVLERLGRIGEALGHIEPLLARSQADPRILTLLAQLALAEGKIGDAGRIEDAIGRLKRRLSGDGLSRGDESGLLFTLGKLLDRNGAYDEAFAAYSRANEIRFSGDREPGFSRRADDMIATFGAANLARLPRAGARSELPLFIVGMPRSGTTLAEQILDSHQDVFGAGELKNVRSLVRGLPERLGTAEPYPQCALGLTQSVVDKLGVEHLADLGGLAPGKARIVNKFPLNFVHLAFIELIAPGARIVHCSRNALDTCLSIYFQSWSFPVYYRKDLASIGRFYRDYERLMGHWRDVLELPIFELANEELIDAPDDMIRALVDFCGLDWDPDCLKFNENKRFVDSSSYDQVRKSVNDGSVGRWRNYEKHLAPLKEALEID